MKEDINVFQNRYSEIRSFHHHRKNKLLFMTVILRIQIVMLDNNYLTP